MMLLWLVQVFIAVVAAVLAVVVAVDFLSSAMGVVAVLVSADDVTAVITADVLFFDVTAVDIVGYVHFPSSLGHAAVVQCCRCSACVVTVVDDGGVVVSSGHIAVVAAG